MYYFYYLLISKLLLLYRKSNMNNNLKYTLYLLKNGLNYYFPLKLNYQYIYCKNPIIYFYFIIYIIFLN